MDFTFNIFAFTLIFFGTLTLFLSYYLYRKEGEAVKFFGIMMLSNAVWSLGYGFELASTDIDQVLFFIKIEYFGITTLPFNWFLFCLRFSGRDKWYKKPLNMGLLSIVPIATILLVWTNEYHHLHYKSYFMDMNGNFPMISLTPGISYRIFTIYFYSLLAIGSYLLIAKFRRSDPIYKRQNYSIIISAMIPWGVNVTYLLDFTPMGNLDLTPFAFIATIFMISLGIYRFQLFDILPVAREKVLDLMRDGFVILDNKKRIIDYNLAFKKYFSRQKDIVGRHIEELLLGQPQFTHFLNEGRPGIIEFQLETNEGISYLEADIRYLNENQINNEATIIKLQDLTTFRQEALKSKLQTEELQKLNQLKDRIFSIIAHDLRGPLVNLSEIFKMIASDLITLEEFKTLSPSLSKDILYTTDLLENILHWSRSQLKGYGINKEHFDIKGLIVNEINYHLPSAKAKKVEIIQDVFPGKNVYADLLMIQIVVRNLLSNAIKFCHEGCTIQITAVYTKDLMLKLCIADNGVGMTEEVLKNLFSGENLSTRGTMNEKGTGLGLVVCRDFMERNNGRITVESTKDIGTKFSVFIPIEEE